MRWLAIIVLASCISKPKQPLRDVDAAIDGPIDAAMLKWTKLPTSIDGRISPRLTWDSANSRALAFGGRAALGVAEDLWELPSDSMTWTQITNVPVTNGIHYQPGFALVTGVPAVFGGVNAGGTTFRNDLHIFANSWGAQIQTSPPTPRAAAALFNVNGSVYVFGGYDNTGELNTYAESSDASFSWTTGVIVASTLSSQGMAVTWDGNRFLALTNPGLGAADQLSAYDPTTKMWTQVCNPCGSRRQDASIVYMSGSNLTLLIGGTDNGGAPVAGTMMLAGDHWVTFDAEMPPGRTMEGVTYDPVNDRVIMFGGSNPDECQMGCDQTYILSR